MKPAEKKKLKRLREQRNAAIRGFHSYGRSYKQLWALVYHEEVFEPDSPLISKIVEMIKSSRNNQQIITILRGLVPTREGELQISQSLVNVIIALLEDK